MNTKIKNTIHQLSKYINNELEHIATIKMLAHFGKLYFINSFCKKFSYIIHDKVSQIIKQRAFAI